jgi:hypothetical protein
LYLRALTDGKVSGTGTIEIKNGNVVALVSTNNSAAAVVVIRRNNDQGKKILDISTITAGMYPPTYTVDAEGAKQIYYDISGTGASAQLYEYIA